MRFSFVLLTWNRSKFLEQCLRELTRSLHKPEVCEVIVVDNGSTDETPAVLARYAGGLVRTIRLKKNYGLSPYKKLFEQARGEYIVAVDDDVLSFPPSLDTLFSEYMNAYPEYGYIALNVVQDEFTNGAKPGPELYTLDVRGEKTLEEGPVGGWCACFRRSDYKKVRLRMMFSRLSMSNGDDGFLTKNFARLGLRAGIIQNAVCFHAAGPYYAKQYGHMEREIEKYRQSGLDSFAEQYRNYK